MASDNMDVAALGRPFTLGMLYDARKDELIPGLTLWNKKTLHDNTVVSPQHSSEFEISTSDSIESKTALLDVNASLKASFFGGLIEVGGSAKYLNDKKTSKNQSRLTFQYKATTNFKQLSMTDLGTMDPQQTDVIQKGSATHVVTAILYGASAFFVFDSEKLEASELQSIQGSMEAVIKKIPSFNVEGKVDIKLTDEEKALTKKFSCKFHGDFLLDNNPASFEDAVKTYIQLPNLLGEKGEKSVPLKVWLMPLKNLDPKAAELKSEISVGLVRKVEDELEDLKEIEMRCNDSLDDKMVKNFPHIHKELSRFQKLCHTYASKLQQNMAKKLESIREGEEDEHSLVQLLFPDDRDESPFSHEKLSKWLDRKEREINVIRSCVEMMEGIKIVQSPSQLDREVLSPGVDQALCFIFTSLQSADPSLNAMAAYLDTLKLEHTSEDLWYYSDDVLTKMRKRSKVFLDLAKTQKNKSRLCFLISAIDNKKYKGATIYQYKDGILVTDDFSKPDRPPVENITDRRDLIRYACDLTLDPNTANNLLTLSEGNKKVTYSDYQSYPDRPERFDKVPQVLCRESLTGRCYWEVAWNNSFNKNVYIGAAYNEIERKGDSLKSKFGHNAISWSFGQMASVSAPRTKLRAWHNDAMWESQSLPSGCIRVGVFLDWPAGTLSIYEVSSNTLSHLYTFHNTFTEPVYPGFWASRSGDFAFLYPIEKEQ